MAVVLELQGHSGRMFPASQVPRVDKEAQFLLVEMQGPFHHNRAIRMQLEACVLGKEGSRAPPCAALEVHWKVEKDSRRQ